ncbi:sensor histidine kinase, partial [Bacillus cereus]|nr:sensor histidine kinase [Bacillus cereus]
MGISTLLLNTFIIIICILSYHVFWLEFKEKITCNNMLFSILSSSAIIFCMTFPLHLPVGVIYGVRFIPILLVFRYGNTKYSVVLG